MRVHDPEVVEGLDAAVYVDDLERALDERDRARRLAVRLEEVVAMRTNVLRAIVEWYDSDTDNQRGRLESLVVWARAQLDVVP